jgi:hypothetical protein
VVTVVSPHLLAVGAAWLDGPEAGAWIAERLGPFGPSLGHAVPHGYAAYAVVPLPPDEDGLRTFEAVLDVLGPFTGEQRVHCGMWDGWPIWYPTGGDPRENTGAGVFWPEGERPSQAEIDADLAGARELVASEQVETPDSEPLELPNRAYYLWAGPLGSTTAFRHHAYAPPSLVWPEDRSWFVGVPIFTNEIAIGGATDVIEAVVARDGLGARRATPDDDLDSDD